MIIYTLLIEESAKSNLYTMYMDIPVHTANADRSEGVFGKQNVETNPRDHRKWMCSVRSTPRGPEAREFSNFTQISPNAEK